MFSVTIREKSGQVYTFHFDKPEIMIGRVKGNDVILPKQNISKRHSLVRARGDRFVIEDLGSTNGTYVNGHRIASPVEITSDDKVYLGDFVMQFFDLGEQAIDDGRAPPVPDTGDQAPAPPPIRYDEAPPAPAESAHRERHDNDLSRDGVFEAEVEQHVAGSRVMNAVDESTMAELDGMAAVARLVAARGHGATRQSPDSGPAPAVAAHDPMAALDAAGLDERMTGPVDGMADIMLAKAAGPELDLDLGMGFGDDLGADLDGGDFGPIETRAESPGHFAPPPSEIQPPVRERDARAAGARNPSGPLDLSGDHHTVVAALYDRATDELHAHLPRDASTLSDAEWTAMEERVVAFVQARARSSNLSPELDLEHIQRDLIYEIAGLGPLEAMLDGADVSLIEVNGPRSIFIVQDGVRKLSGARFSGQPALLAAAERLVRATGSTVDSDAAHAAGALADGTSVHIVWPPLCANGPAMVLRKPRAAAPSIEDLIARRQLTEAAAERLLDALAAERSIAICGPIGSGRRTLMGALADQLAPSTRVLIVEHGVRTKLRLQHVVRIDSTAVSRDRSALTVARSLRPDRLLVCADGRGELADMIGIAFDGLPPWLGSFYAHSADDLLRRAVDGFSLVHAGISEQIARSCVATAIDVVASYSLGPDGRSVLDSVGEVHAEGDKLTVHSLLGR